MPGFVPDDCCIAVKGCLSGARRAVVAGVMLVLLSSMAAGQTRDEDETYFNGLRERRLFSLAESVCLKRLEQTDLSAAERSRFTVELSRTLAEHALHVRTVEEQSDLFDRARKAIQDLLDEREPGPNALLLRSQLLFVSARQVESIRLRLELTPFDDKLRKQAIDLATETIPELKRLQNDMRAALRRPVGNLSEGDLKPFQLRGLQRVCRFRMASMMLDQARLFAKGTPDRAQALLQAEEEFRSLAEGAPGERITWQSQLGLVTAIRLRGDTPAASRLLKAMARDKPPAAVMDEITAEQAELLLLDGHMTDAVQLIREYRKQRPQLSGRLLWVQANALQQLSRVAASQGQKADADEFLEHAATLVRLAQISPGGFWAMRCQQLLTGARQDVRYGEAVAKLVRQAESRYASGQLEQSIELYREAFAESRKEDADAAVELGYLLGSILLQATKNREAATQFQLVVEIQPDGPRAADADLLAAFAIGLLYRDEPTKANRERYTSVLEAHRSRFQESKTAHEATWLLAQLEERRLQSTRALQLYVTIPAEHSRGPAAQVSVARCGETILARLRRLKKPVTEWETAIVTRLTPFIESVPADGLLSEEQSELLLRTTRILLTMARPDFEQADLLLKRLQAQQPEAGADELPPSSRELLDEASRWRVIALAGRGEINEARYLLERAARDGTENLLTLFDGLQRAAESLPEETRNSLGDLLLRTLQLANVDPDNVDGEARERLLRGIAGAHELAGNSSTAARYLEQLLALRKNDVKLRQQAARLQMASGRTPDLKAAKANWQKIEASLKAGSAGWMDARVQLLQCLLLLGEKEECRKLLKFTRLLYRDAGSETTRKQLAALERQLAGNPAPRGTNR